MTEACPENSKAGSEEMEATTVTFVESSDKMAASNLKATLEPMEAIVKRQELLKKELNFDNIRYLKDHYGDRHLVVRHR